MNLQRILEDFYYSVSVSQVDTKSIDPQQGTKIHFRMMRMIINLQKAKKLLIYFWRISFT